MQLIVETEASLIPSIEFGTKTTSTKGLWPQDLIPNKQTWEPHADAKMDWWMLAATLSEKALDLRWGEGAANPTTRELLDAISLAIKRGSEGFERVWQEL